LEEINQRRPIGRRFLLRNHFMAWVKYVDTIRGIGAVQVAEAVAGI